MAAYLAVWTVEEKVQCLAVQKAVKMEPLKASKRVVYLAVLMALKMADH